MFTNRIATNPTGNQATVKEGSMGSSMGSSIEKRVDALKAALQQVIKASQGITYHEHPADPEGEYFGTVEHGWLKTVVGSDDQDEIDDFDLIFGIAQTASWAKDALARLAKAKLAD